MDTQHENADDSSMEVDEAHDSMAPPAGKRRRHEGKRPLSRHELSKLI